jgi:hypothetical protein
MNDHPYSGEKLVVEFAGKRKANRNRRGPTRDDKCFNCHNYGHW